MDKQEIYAIAKTFLEETPGNRIENDDFHCLRLFDAPIFAVADAHDPMFAALKRPGVIGEHFAIPEAWLPDAKSVISFFLPFSEAVRSSNAVPGLPSKEWTYGRVEGQELICALDDHLVEKLKERGVKAVAPARDPNFWAAVTAPSPCVPEYTSNWSERHVAYIAGLGTFGLSAGLITRLGIAGRFCSIITDLPLETDTRDYTGVYDYCIKCGACIPRCPGGAISMTGKEHLKCHQYISSIREKCAPRFGCGKCQTAVPCEHSAPGRMVK